jgi:glyoxylase-like metal-dependent hydrolase (beta-lactamase superfamily II)
VAGGDVLDLGGRRLTVVELPGHTPGGVGLLDEEEGALFSGDAIYDGWLIDTLPESDVDQYVRTMELLRTLDVDVVYPGHDEPFGRQRLRELAEAYLRRVSG